MTYLDTRGHAGLVRTQIASVTMLNGLIPTLLMATPEGAHGTLPGLVTVTATIGLILLGLIWARRVPTQMESRIVALGTTTLLAAAALACRDPWTALMLCSGLAVPAGYIAFAHKAIDAVYNFQVAMGVGIIEGARLAMSGKPIQGLFGLWTLFMLILSVPAGIQIIVHSLGMGLREADTDPLTLALNRRAFFVKSQEVIRRGRGSDSYLMVMVIDLDGFKVLNDTLGHPIGDRALVGVAEILRAQTRDGAVIGRSGGDEFMIADTTGRSDQTAIAERLRASIAAMPYPITASIGIATAALDDIMESAVGSAIEDLVTSADALMYTAKRAGGDEICHSAAC